MCNCNNKTYQINMCCTPRIADASNFYTKGEVDEIIEELESGITSGCCITPEEVDDKISAATSGFQETLIPGDNITISGNVISAEVPSLSGYATEQWVLDKHYISGVDLSDYAQKTYVDSSVSGKQDTLSAGTNITIVDNVISAQGGGKTIEGGRGISVTTGETADTVSFNLPISAGTGSKSIIQGYNTSATTSASYSHAEGSGTTASGKCSHAEGLNTRANANYSHAEGSQTKAFVEGAHVEGSLTSGMSYYVHAEGEQTIASGECSHAEGYMAKANGNYSHAEGDETKANGNYSHAEGSVTQANGRYSHAEGSGTVANNDYEHASGRFNVSNTSEDDDDSEITLFSVGNGTYEEELIRHNAFEIRRNGDIYLSSGGTDIKLQDHLGGGASYSAGTNVQINNNVISATDTTYTAGDNITISNSNVISTVTKFWCGDSTAWSQISGGTLDANTIYMVY